MSQNTGGEHEFEEIDEIDEAPADVRFEAPADFESVSTDVEAYWTATTPIEFEPRGVRLLDNGKEAAKSSCLVIAELKKPTMLRVNAAKKEEQVLKEFPAGATIGIWAKAGMRDLQNLGGAHVWMAPNGKRSMKDKDKNAMALFTIKRLKSSEKGSRLTLIEDARKKSRKEPALAENPPWWLIVLGDDLGKGAAQRILRQELELASAPS